MENKITIFIFFFALVAISSAVSEKILVKEFIIKKDADLPEIHSYAVPEWRNANEFAIYGWFKINQWIHSEVPILNFSTSQISAGSYGHQQHKFVVQDNAFIFETYNLQNYEPNQYMGRLSYDNNDFGQWIFVYQAFNTEKQKMFTYLKSPNKELKILNERLISHIDTEYIQLILGPKHEILNDDQIEMKNISIRWGEDSYQESNFENLMQENDIPLQEGEICSHLYSECGFKGEFSIQCGTFPFSSNRFFKSIYVAPNAIAFTIAPPVPRFSKAFVVKFNESIECVDHTKYLEYAEQGKLIIVSLPDM